MSVASLCAMLVYLVMPADGWGLFGGRPLGPLSITVLAVACLVASARGALIDVRVLVIALVLKIVLHSTLMIPHGFAARYYANSSFAQPIERAIEPADPSFTRTDHRLRFGFESEPDVPLEFFNDLRFNYYLPTEPDRTALPFSVAWEGWWRVTNAGPQSLYLHSPGGVASLSVGDRYAARIDPADTWTGVVDVAAGFQRIAITWSVPRGGGRRFEAGRIVDGREEPFGDDVIRRSRAGGVARAADAVVRVISRTFDALIAAWLVLQLARGLTAAYRRLRVRFTPGDVLTLVLALGIADALVFAVPSVGRLVMLSGGDDWLTYESEARDIALNGLWMREGAAFGHGRAFYTQPLYPYFLAVCHWLFGGGLFGVYFIQRLLAAVTVILIWRTVARLLDERAGLAALLTGVVVVYQKFAPWCGILLTEVLFVPLLCLWLYTLVRMTDQPSIRRGALLAGVVGGLATLTRSSLLLGWVMVVPALALAIGPRRHRMVALAILVSMMVAVTSVATVRNWVVAHRLVLVSSEGTMVLFLGNSPPPLPIPPAHHTQYERLGLDVQEQAVAEYVRTRPQAFLRGLWRKAKFTLGWFDELQPGSGTSRFYILTWGAALFGVLLMQRIWPTRSGALMAIPLLVAASHFIVVVVFQPHVYGDRLVMPFYLMIVPYVAVVVLLAARAAGTALGPERAAAVLFVLLLLASAARMAGSLVELDLPVLAVACVVGGLCLAGSPQLPSLRVAIYLAYSVALAAWLVRVPAAHPEAACRAEWLFLTIALMSGPFLSDRLVRHTVACALFALAATASALLAVTDVAARAAVLGSGAAVAFATVPFRAIRIRRALVYAAGSVLAIVALQGIGVSLNPERALLRGRVAAFGIVGAAAYALVWVEACWPDRGNVWTHLTKGLVFGAFVLSLEGGEFGPAGASLPIIAGLAMGQIHADMTDG